jgi:hypothetical protein
MSAHNPRPGRRRAPRLIGPAVLNLVRTLQRVDGDAVEIRLSTQTAAAIARIDARHSALLVPHGIHPAYAAVARNVAVDRATATRWSAHAWQAVGEGLVASADAQALSDQIEPRGAA